MNKDNPVPSLEEDIQNLLNKYEHYFSFREDKKFILRKEISNLIQNGVETNKVQPKLYSKEQIQTSIQKYLEESNNLEEFFWEIDEYL
jgi:collagenase-like PrtC family protease